MRSLEASERQRTSANDRERQRMPVDISERRPETVNNTALVQITNTQSIAERGTRIAENRTPQSAIRNPHFRVGSAGYLLLEVILALAILTMVVALVFRIIQTTVRVTSDVQYLQSEQEHADGLYELLRKHFDSMPPTAQFQTRRVQNELELIFLESPFHFSWIPSGPQFGSTVIAARRQADGRYTLAVVQEPEDSSVSYATSGEPTNATWIPMVNGLREFNWRFFDGRTGEWKTDWKDPGAKPALFECTFEVSGQAGPTRAVFRCPIAPVQ